MYFFKAEDGSRFLVTDVQHVEPISEQEQRSVAVVWLRGDRSALLEKSELARMMALPAMLTPAQPNTYTLAMASGDSSELDIVRRTAVVAWAMGFDGVLRAVTVDGVGDDAHELTVETSDGFVTARGARRWLSVEAWLRDQLNPPPAV